MAATVAQLIGLKMPYAMAKVLGSDGQNGGKTVELAGVGMPMAQARLLGTDQPGGGVNVPRDALVHVKMPWAHAYMLGV